MQLIKRYTEVETRTVNMNQGGNHDYFTDEELKKFWSRKADMVNGCYSLEAEVHYHAHRTELKADRAYIEGKLGLRELLRIMAKLSKGEKGALSKQLYPYYQKVAASRLKYDLERLHKEVHYIDITNLNDRQCHYSYVYIYIGNKKYYGHGDGHEALEDIGKDHLKRCIAILADKGYIEINNTKKTKWMRGYDYTYSNTYYKLTEKAEKLLSQNK